MASVILENVSKVYDNKVTAIKNANLKIDDTEFVVLVGPSGCGKSTLLRMIAGLEEITSGKIYIGDKVVNDISPKDRNIAMVFQNYALYPHMTVFDNMAFGLKLRKFPKDEINKRVNETAELLGIKPYLDRKPKALSGGQRQRVAVGRAIVRQPQVFLFDEPLSNLDAKLRVQMRIEINKLHKRLRTTMIYVTHDQVEAMTMGDRIVVLKDGVIQQVDSPLNLYNRPVNLFVAGFIGSPAMNFIRGNLQRNGTLQFKTPDFQINLTPAHEQLLKSYQKSEVILGIRPEHFELYEQKLHNTYPTLDAEIEVVEPMGAETYAYLKAGKTSLSARFQSSEAIESGKKVKLALVPEKIHFFDPETERAIR
ncbi:glycerol-3-phosphate ABC transporter ATP-binding protein [candidate division KSB1 bacterium]|nr:MAG: glycerol-3-phosphate ABC transporter ATP-binding protein [candidate division KSB1 bacterium]